MSEDTDAQMTSSGTVPLAETVQGNEAAAPTESGSLTAASEPSAEPVHDHCQAIIFSEMREASSEEFEEEKVNEYKKYLREECGFPVTSHDSRNLEYIKQTLSDAAVNFGNHKRIFTLVVRKSEREADLDEIVACLKERNAEAEKLVIFCRIVTADSNERAECLKLKDCSDRKKTLRNTIIINSAVKTPQLAVEFLNMMMTLMKKCNWSSNRFARVVQCPLTVHQNSRYGIIIQDGLVPNLLEENEHISKTVGNGSYLKNLDGAVIGAFVNSNGGSSAPSPSILRTDLASMVYRNSGERKALIINNDMFDNPKLADRPGSKADCENLRYTLEQRLQYKVEIKSNLKAVEIRDAVKAFANDQSHADSCILVVMSHGCLGAICGTDFKEDSQTGRVDENELLDFMRKGSGVKMKPRLVLFQACREDMRSEVARNEQPDTVSSQEAAQVAGLIYHGCRIDVSEPPPEQCGMIVGHSTSLGEYAFRSTMNGSRFIVALCITFLSFAHKEDVVSMITRVNYIMTHGFKMPFDDERQYPMQLPWWSVQTDKKFFLVDTKTLFEAWQNRHGEVQDAQGQAALSS